MEVTSERARDLRAWCSGLSGWDPECAPLVFEAARGRPPSSRRSTGPRFNVRVSDEEGAAISTFAAGRGLSEPELMRRCTLLEIRRDAIRAKENADEIMSAEAVLVEALAVGEHVYSDGAHVTLRGRSARVIALRQENELWCLELVDTPIWLAAGTRILRRR